MDTENILLLKREIMKMYSHDFSTKVYTFLRLKLTPIAKLEKYVPKEGNVLDLGCGTGIFPNILYLGSQKRNLLGVDISATRVEAAKRASKGRPQLKFMVGDVNEVALAGFEIITLIDLLHHMPYTEQDYLLENIYANLQKGEILLIKDLEKAPYWKYIFHYIQDRITNKGGKLFFRSAAEMDMLLTKIGFSVETVPLSVGYAYPHVLYRCTKLPGNSSS